MSEDIYRDDGALMRGCIVRGIVLPIPPTDNEIDVKIKGFINTLVLNDSIKNYNWCGKTYYYNKSLNDVSDALVKCNQIRLKHWFFKPVNINDNIKFKLNKKIRK